MKKLASLFALLAVASLLLAACQPAVETTVPEATEVVTDVPATEEPTVTLKLWIYDDTRLAALQEIGNEFEAEYGVAVVVEVVDLSEIRSQMALGASSGEGPDVIIIPHDNLGPLVENGAAAEVDISAIADNLLSNAIDGFTYNGKTYGVPLSVENIGFFRNTDMVPEAPATWAEVAQIGTELVQGGQAETAIALPDLGYNIYPLFTAYGGYIFGRDADGNFTVDDFGINNEGMAEAYAWIKALVDAGVVSSNIDWEAAHVSFETGKSPFIMTGPWAITRFNTAGVHYAISAFPSVEDGGDPGYPFMGVQGLVVNANSPNLALAQTFATEFLPTEAHYQALFVADTRPSAWQTVFEGATDANTQGFNAAGVSAEPMPSIPAMGYVWDAWANAGNLIITGQQDIQSALDNAKQQVLDQVNK